MDVGGGPSGAGRAIGRDEDPVALRAARRAAGPAGSAAERIDWDGLRASAVDAAGAGYAPYSGLLVGAAALVAAEPGAPDPGAVRVIVGCNVENASYGLGACAEVTMAGQLRLSGGGRLRAVACRSAAGELLMPCGRCRQVIYEFGGPDCLCDTPRGPRPMSEVLPDAFGPADLPSGRP